MINSGVYESSLDELSTTATYVRGTFTSATTVNIHAVVYYRHKETGKTVFSAAQYSLLGSNTVTQRDDVLGGYAVIMLGGELNFSVAATIYMAYYISSGANPKNSVGVCINSRSYLNVCAPKTVLNAGDFPIQTATDYSLPVQLATFAAYGEPNKIVL